MFRDFKRVLIAGTLAVAIAGTASAQTKLRLPAADCAALVVHKPAPDVAFKPGRDAHSGRVAPADLPGSQFVFETPKTVEFDISFNPLAGRAARRFPKTELVIGRLEYDLESGAATLNGEPLSGPELAELARKCQRGLGENR